MYLLKLNDGFMDLNMLEDDEGGKVLKLFIFVVDCLYFLFKVFWVVV